MNMVFNKSVCLALIRALPDLVGGVRVCSAYDMNVGAGFCISASSLCGSGGNASSVFVDATYDGKRLLSLVFANESEALVGVRDMSWAILSGLEAIAVGLVANAPCLPVDAAVGAVSGASGGVKAVKRGKGGVAVKKKPVKPVKSRAMNDIVAGVIKKRGKDRAVVKKGLGFCYPADVLYHLHENPGAVLRGIARVEGLPVLEVA